MIRLITNYYTSSSKVRQAEINTCIDNNSQSLRFVGGIVHTIHDDVDGRPTYRKYFELANTLSCDDDITIISNSDIRFEIPDLLAIQEHMRPELCMALTRWDTNGSVPRREYADGTQGWKVRLNKYSQDTWVFKGKIRLPKNCDFYMGIPGCDNRIAWELYNAGYKMVNPCKSIKTFHHHESGCRTGTCEKIEPPYLLVNHTTIEEIDNKQTPRNIRMYTMEV